MRASVIIQDMSLGSVVQWVERLQLLTAAQLLQVQKCAGSIPDVSATLAVGRRGSVEMVDAGK